MSDEFDSTSVDSNNVYYSPFWPLAILMIGIIGWVGYQLFTLNQQRTQMNAQLAQMEPVVGQAAAAQTRLLNLLKDLATTSQKDTYAAQIMRDAERAGIIRVTQNPTNAAPATGTGVSPTGMPPATSPASSTETNP